MGKICALILLATTSAFAQADFTILATEPRVGGEMACETLAQDGSGSYDNNSATGAFYTWLAGSFTAGSTFTVCAAELRLQRINTLSGTIQVKIYTSSGGNPGTLIGTGSSTVDVSTVSTSANYVSFTGLSASVSSGTGYFVVLECSSAFNNLLWVDHTGSGVVRGSQNGSSWDNLGTSRSADFKLYSQP